MPLPFYAQRLLFITGLLSLQACGFMQVEVNQLADSLESQGAARTLESLEKIQPPERDRVQYLMNRGTLKQLSGDREGARSDLEAAKELSEQLAATSLTENIGAVTVNETLRSYVGSPSERVIIHSMLAFNYLAVGDLLGARVEMLQADVTMRQLAKSGSNSGQLASANYLTGIIFELNNEIDNAMISYRRAAELIEERGQRIPTALADSLLDLSQRLGLREEYTTYQQRFGRTASPLAEGEREIIVFYSDGVVTNKRQHFISVYSYQLKQNIAIALPYYPDSRHLPSHLSFAAGDLKVRTQLLESVEQLAREDLDDEMPAITATTLARAVAKYQAVNEAQRKDDIAGLLLNLATTFSETADRRSWNMLPATLQVARFRVPEGEPVYLEDGSVLDDPEQHHQFLTVNFKQDQVTVILASSINLPPARALSRRVSRND